MLGPPHGKDLTKSKVFDSLQSSSPQDSRDPDGPRSKKEQVASTSEVGGDLLGTAGHGVGDYLFHFERFL
jgi:hypothetical protein